MPFKEAIYMPPTISKRAQHSIPTSCSIESKNMGNAPTREARTNIGEFSQLSKDIIQCCYFSRSQKLRDTSGRAVIALERSSAVI